MLWYHLTVAFLKPEHAVSCAVAALTHCHGSPPTAGITSIAAHVAGKSKAG